MRHDVTPELAAAFTKRVAAMGYSTQPTTDNKLLFTICKQDMEICQFEKSGAQRYYPDMPLVNDRIRLNRLMADMKQAHDLYADAPPFEAVEVEGFRLISAFGSAVLAAKRSADNEVRFVTWQYTYDRTAVTLGHYYETNYEGAKKDFAIRAGLVDENQLFTEEELVILHDSCVFRGRNDDGITYDDERRLVAVMEKVESNIPNRIFDHEQEQDYGQGMEV